MSNTKPAPEASTPTTPKTISRWDAFSQAGLVPISVVCQAYHPFHLHDGSCHSKLSKFTSEQIKTHNVGEHGSAFEIYLRKADGKTAPLWQDLSSSGLEAADFRCAVCSKQLRFHPSSILQHMRPHGGNTRQAYREAIADRTGCIGKVQVTFTNFRPEGDGEDWELESDN